MAVVPRWLRVPRPRTFLYLMSLRTGTELISLSMIFNKLSGFYGLIAILTGFTLSPLQLSMYLYSLAALGLLAFLMRHIREQSPFHCLALAWFYLIDTVVNTAFTAAFAVTWLLAVSADKSNTEIPSGAPGKETMDDAAGFTNPKYTSVGEVMVSPTAIPGGNEAVSLAATVAAAAVGGTPTLGDAVGIEESIPSIMVVVLLTLIRVYFILVVMAFARQVLRQHMYSSSTTTKTKFHTDGTVDMPASNPFVIEGSGGEGLKGKLGRLMVKVGEGYWLGGQADDNWAKGLDGRFRTRRVPSGPPGTVERERRARSGTGPPIPSPRLP